MEAVGFGKLPNAIAFAGKSTLLRATCVAQVMAQAGCWVPAATATLSIADRIFTRLGETPQTTSPNSSAVFISTFASGVYHSMFALRDPCPQVA